MKKAIFGLTALSVALTGCSNMISVKRDVDQDMAHNTQTVDKQLAAMTVNQKADQRLLYTTVVPGAWLGASKIADRHKAELPDVFTKDVTLVFPDRANLSTIAERLTKVTGIPVKLRPDVFIKASDLLPKSGSSSSGGQDSTRTPMAGLMPVNGIVGSTSTSSDYSLDSTLNYTGSLGGLLDTLCAKAGINWEYKDGKIVLYRMVTKTFTLKSTPGSSQLTASVGKSGSAQIGTASASGGGGGSSAQSGSFAADSTVKMDSSFSVWQNLKESVNAMLTPVGKVAVTEATGTITVSDTREVVDQIGSMLDQINKSLSRQVAFRVEVLSLETTKGADYGVDWSLIFNKLVANNPAYKVTMGSPASLASANAGSLTYSVLTPSGASNNMSQLNGSQAMLAAMSSLGRASVVTTASALTLNRQPVPVAITDQVGYVQSVSAQTGASSSTGSSSSNTVVQINPGTVTTGFILNLLPSVTEDDSVLLQFSVDISSLKAMPSFGQGQLMVQTPEVTGMQFLQRVGLKNGQTLVLSGFERTAGQYDRRTMTEDTDLLAGGSLAGTRKREAIVILITPVISEGA